MVLETNPNDSLEAEDRTDAPEHVEILRVADETLKHAEEAIKEGRQRLERAIARYAERARG